MKESNNDLKTFMGKDALNKLIELILNELGKKSDIPTEISNQTVADIWNDEMHGHTHRFDLPIDQVDATCTTAGSITYECRCGEQHTESIPKIHHTTEVVRTEPTCTEDGSEVTRCTVCGEVLSKTTIPATGHSYTSEITVNATCMSEGIKTYKCRCGEQYTEILPKIDHDLSFNGTCTMCGKKDLDYRCSITPTNPYIEYDGTSHISKMHANVYDKNDGVTLIEGVHYEIRESIDGTFDDPNYAIEPGEYNIHVDGIGEYIGTYQREIKFTITKIYINNAYARVIYPNKYGFIPLSEAKSGKRPNIIVEHNGETLIEGQDYVIREKENGSWDDPNWITEEGRYDITIDGINHYQGITGVFMYITDYDIPEE